MAKKMEELISQVKLYQEVFNRKPDLVSVNSEWYDLQRELNKVKGAHFPSEICGIPITIDNTIPDFELVQSVTGPRVGTLPIVVFKVDDDTSKVNIILEELEGGNDHLILGQLQKLVDGYVEIIKSFNTEFGTVQLIANDEGAINGSPFNNLLGVHGTAVMVGLDKEDNYRGLTDKEVEIIIGTLLGGIQ